MKKTYLKKNHKLCDINWEYDLQKFLWKSKMCDFKEKQVILLKEYNLFSIKHSVKETPTFN